MVAPCLAAFLFYDSMGIHTFKKSAVILKNISNQWKSWMV